MAAKSRKTNAKMGKVASFGLEYFGAQSFAGHPVGVSRRVI